MIPKSRKLPIIKVLATGGTIGTRGRDRLDLVEYPDFGQKVPFENVLGDIPELGDIAQLQLDQFRNISSTAVTPTDMLELSQRINSIFHTDPDVAGIVVTHGTNSLEETAYFLHLTVQSDRPVVVVGAMRPMSGLSSDTQLNFLDAVRVAASAEASGKGVLVVLNQEISSARDVTKINSLRASAFNSKDLGFLGFADPDGRVVFYRKPTRLHTCYSEFNIEHLSRLPRVDISYSYTGSDGTVIDALAAVGSKGIVTAGLGNGATTPLETAALERAYAEGIVIVQSTRTGSGRVSPTQRRKERCFLVADNLNPQKARILLILALTLSDQTDIQRIFDQY